MVSSTYRFPPCTDTGNSSWKCNSGKQGCKYCMYFSFKLSNSLEGLLCQNKSVSIIYILLRNILPYISRKLIRAKNIVFLFFLNCTQPLYWHCGLSLVESDDSFRAKHLNLYLTVEQALKKQYSHVSKWYIFENTAFCRNRFQLQFLMLKIQ